MSENKEAKWYILHTYAGYENIVKANLEQMIENNNLQEQILDIKIPTEQTIEEKISEIRLVNHAKWLLIECLSMTEAEAQRYIEKKAMDARISKKEMAESVIKTYE